MIYRAFLPSSVPETGNEAFVYHEFRNLFSLRYGLKYVVWFITNK